MAIENCRQHDPAILFFILDFLLLFYDNRSIGILARRSADKSPEERASVLFFILIFLLLFY